MGKRFNVSSVVRVRAHQPSRLDGFVDAAFAFAVTLVVISIGHVPNSVPEMLTALRGVPAFAACFALISRIWKAHRDWSRHYGLDDDRAVVLSLLLVFLILVFVYPLRLVFELTFASASGGWLSEQPIGFNNIDELRVIFILYGIGFGIIAAIFAMLFHDALRSRAQLELDAAEILVTRMQVDKWRVIVCVSLLSALLAWLLPFTEVHPVLYMVPGCTHLLNLFLLPMVERHYLRLVAELRPA
jgi:uncharacterized membrane protein